MATISSAAVTPSLSLYPSTRFTSFSSSSSVFFSYNVCKQARFGLSVDRPRRAKKRGLSCNCLFGLGVPELVVIAGVAALVFGPKKLPEVGRSIGKTVKSFQQGSCMIVVSTWISWTSKMGTMDYRLEAMRTPHISVWKFISPYPTLREQELCNCCK